MRLPAPLLPFCALLCSASAACTTPAATGQAWVQYSARGVELRAVTPDARCPDAIVDGTKTPMDVRSEPAEGYPARTCALALPASAHQVEVLGRTPPLPKADPKRILLLGDTGCRMKGNDFQACNDPSAWPFARIAATAAALHPDLIIHLGDYLYREAACPAGNKGCEGSPWGDSLGVWEADFLKPADPLLSSAPWLLVRGNHEECTRAGKGWSRLFDPAPFDAAKGCNPPAEPLRVKLGAVDLVDFDNSSVDHKKLEPEQVKSVRSWLEGTSAGGEGKPLWAFMHRPVRGVVAVKDGKLIGGNQSLAEGLSQAPKGLQYYFSGHQHTFQVLNFADGSAPQIIAGHGSASLDGQAPAGLSGLEVAGKTIAAAYSQMNQFGFVLLERAADGWTMTNHDRSGAVTMRCALQAAVVCEPVAATKTAGN